MHSVLCRHLWKSYPPLGLLHLTLNFTNFRAFGFFQPRKVMRKWNKKLLKICVVYNRSYECDVINDNLPAFMLLAKNAMKTKHFSINLFNPADVIVDLIFNKFPDSKKKRIRTLKYCFMLDKKKRFSKALPATIRMKYERATRTKFRIELTEDITLIIVSDQ